MYHIHISVQCNEMNDTLCRYKTNAYGIKHIAHKNARFSFSHGNPIEMGMDSS